MRARHMPLLRVSSPYFVAGIVPGEVAAPILGYMMDWDEASIRFYCDQQGWDIEDVVTSNGGFDE